MDINGKKKTFGLPGCGMLRSLIHKEELPLTPQQKAAEHQRKTFC